MHHTDCLRLQRRTSRYTAALLGLLIVPAAAHAREAAAFYQQNCASCHTIGGGRLVGPDLKDVSKRQDREWLTAFILNPQAVINRGDPYARKILEESRGVVMPAVPGITRERALALLDLIDAESQLERSQFAGMQMSDRPFTAEDVALGREYFLGTRPLARGGPACVACHDVSGLKGLGGGRLGPDLTKVYERIGGRKPLAAWLVGPATTTMRPVFRDHPLQSEEILPLVAFFEKAAQDNGGARASAAPLSFFLLGLGGAVLGLLGCDALWRRRFRAVRALMVSPASRKAHT